ncbi:MAG TPA: DUF4252 domain-containing protein [Lacipirellulaceae bacterium]|jgi:hypothetical protein|nr:DUF4252 domain-containing protein [Lacipirellulaceae bacterium]
MVKYCSHLVRGGSSNFMLAAATVFLAIISHAQAADSPATVGRIDFDAARLPEANVEIDLSQDMFKSLFGIGDAALTGVAESLVKSAGGSDGAKGARLAADQLEAARKILQLAGNVVREVRVRVYESLPEDKGGAEKLFKPFDDQLHADKWETLARVHDDENIVRVSAVRNGGSIQGIFVTATDGDNVVIANVVCDISPENVKTLTSTATKIGLENGLAQVIEQKMKRFPGANDPHTVIIKNGDKTLKIVTPVTPVPPTPPAPPAVPAEPAN